MFKEKSKSGQVGETLTWIVATILVFVMMLLFILGASLLSSTKSVEKGFKESLISAKSTFEGTDPFLKKSLFTYVTLSSDSKRLVYNREFNLLASKDAFAVDFNQTKKDIVLRYNKR